MNTLPKRLVSRINVTVSLPLNVIGNWVNAILYPPASLRSRGPNCRKQDQNEYFATYLHSSQMTGKSVFRRFFRILLIVVGIHAIVILGLHIWFVNNARGVLRQIVSEKSEGKLKLKLAKLSFDFFSNKLQIREAALESTDTLTQPATYHVSFRKLTLRIHSFWPLVLQKKLVLDSIKLHDPTIKVLLWRKDTASAFEKEDLSLPQEMGKLYNSMLDVLDGFGIRRILINNATLSLVNKMKPGSRPVTITNVYLDVQRTSDRKFNRQEIAEHEQSVDLHTSNQNISLPGGRHQLAFKTFSLHLFRRYIELDSCTITATPTETFKSSYKIFFSKLLLIGVDFNAMYRDNLIRADSVYCENPLFDFNLVPSGLTNKKDRPDPERIVRELSGNLDLAFVGVKNAGFHININGTRPRSLFNSNKDNFEMRGLRINADSSVPVMVDQFDMLVRDYRLYNEDSSTVYSFDSVKFKNNKIVLNNFSVTTTSSRYTARSNRDYRIPYFELTGLDWYRLVFDETLEAREAVLYHPVINYTRNERSIRKKKANLFESLQNIDNLVTLNRINILQGEINMNLGSGKSFQFHDVNLSLYSDKLLKSTNKEGLRRAVDYLSFSNGVLKSGDITARLSNTQYTDTNLIHAEKLLVTSGSNKITADVEDVYIANMLMDDDIETVVVDGLRWKKATVTLDVQRSNKAKKAMLVHFKNVSGLKTNVTVRSGNSIVHGVIDSLAIQSLTKYPHQPLMVEGVLITGDNVVFANETMQLSIDNFRVGSELPSYLQELTLESKSESDTILLTTQRLDFSADVNKLLAGDIHFETMQATNLHTRVASWKKSTLGKKSVGNRLPNVRIDEFIAPAPFVNVATYRNDSLTLINVPASPESNFKASNVLISKTGIQIGTVKINSNAATFLQSTGQKFGVDTGTVELEASSLIYSTVDSIASWKGNIDKLFLDNPIKMQIGKANSSFSVSQLSLGNLRLSSEHISDFSKFMKYNVGAWFKTTTGKYIDSNSTYEWFNAGYNNQTRTLSLDSFSYAPTRSRDSVLINTPYQADYTTFRSAGISFVEFDIDRYRADTAFVAREVNIVSPEVRIYRDKLPPLRTGVIKPLPVNAIQQLSFPVGIQQVNIKDGELSYTEKNAKTRAEAVVYLTDINGSLSNIKNRDILRSDSLNLSLNGYLLDSAFIDLRVKQSYLDTLSGFLMTLRVQPTSLSFLNPVLTPLSNVIIKSGNVDSLHLRAIGTEHIAFGEMNMYYHNLRIKLVKPGEPDKTTFKTRLISRIANTFVIKKHNRGRTGLVYFERLRDRSFFNYIVKMTFSGLATSVGFKKNQKYRKLYERRLQNSNLPAIEL